MRFWVTGARGMLGHEVCAVLAARMLAYVDTDRELDITNLGTIEAFAAREPFTHVINCAAYTAVDACETHEADATAVNADGAMHVARVARAREAIAIHLSTDYVFDGANHVPYDELDRTGPINAYGRSKLAGEQRFLAEGPARGAYVVRTSWMFGPRGANFVTTMLRLLGERPEVRVVDDQTGRPTYAPDLAAALVDLALLRPAGGIYHFANDGQVTWYGLACAVRTAAIARGRKADAVISRVTAAEFGAPARRPAWSVLSTEKLEGALARPLRPWREALTAYFEAIT